MPKISYILICYNGAASVGLSIASILTLPAAAEAEIILVDDGSQDNTLEVFRTFQANHKNIQVVENQQNMGRAPSRNRGLEVSTGDYVCFIDADDFVNAVYFQGIPEALNDGVDMLVTGRLDFDIDERLPSSASHVDTLFSELNVLTSAENFPDCLSDNFVTGKFVSKVLLDKHKIQFDEERKNAEDILFSAALWLNSERVRFHHLPFYSYGRGNYRRKFGREKCRDVLINLSKLKDFCDDGASFRRKELIANKYAKGLVEVINRGCDNFSQRELVAMFAEYFDASFFDAVPFLRFVSNKERAFVNACRNGQFQLAVSYCKK